MCGRTCDQFVDSLTKTITIYMVHILVGLVHIYSFESTVKRGLFRIFAMNVLENQFPQRVGLAKCACEHMILTSCNEMRRSIIV